MRYKFPRIYHFSDSPNLQNDDRRHEDESVFIGKEVCASIKMDGEATSIYKDYIHARSIDSKKHPSREWIKQLQGKIGYLIPDNFRLCGENLYAVHSIEYRNLKSYFYLYAIFNENNYVLSWDDTITWSKLLELELVDVFYRGVYNRKFIHEKFEEHSNLSLDNIEGYVVRIADSFHYEDYSKYSVKYVRLGHVQTNEHWMTKKVIPNGLKIMH